MAVAQNVTITTFETIFPIMSVDFVTLPLFAATMNSYDAMQAISCFLLARGRYVIVQASLSCLF